MSCAGVWRPGSPGSRPPASSPDVRQAAARPPVLPLRAPPSPVSPKRVSPDARRRPAVAADRASPARQQAAPQSALRRAAAASAPLLQGAERAWPPARATRPAPARQEQPWPVPLPAAARAPPRLEAGQSSRSKQPARVMRAQAADPPREQVHLWRAQAPLVPPAEARAREQAAAAGAAAAAGSEAGRRTPVGRRSCGRRAESSPPRRYSARRSRRPGRPPTERHPS